MGKERARTSVLAGAVVAAICDADQERARALALAGSCHGAKTVDAPGNLPYSDLDAIFVCTPPGNRGGVERAAIEAEVPFLVEKPIAIAAAAAEPVLEALSRKPVIHAVGYMNRYRASLQYARRILANCRLLGIIGFWAGRKYEVPWWLDPLLSGGPVNEQATHMLDVCRYLAGDVEAIEGVSQTVLRVAATLRFWNGCLGTVFYSCEARDKQIGFRIITSEGGLELSGWDFRMSSNSIDGTIPADHDEDIFLKETTRFLAAVRTGDRSLIACTFEDAYRTQCLIDAIRGGG